MAELLFTDTISIPGDWGQSFFGTGPAGPLQQVGSVLDCSEICAFFAPADADTYGFEETFLPQRIYIREEMNTAFRELLNNGNNTFSVFSGSPGIGKSILLFMVVLYRATVHHEKAVYLRRTDETMESTSWFVFEYNKEENIVRARFNRIGNRADSLPVVYTNLRASFAGIHYLHPSIVVAVDGPKSSEYTNFTKITYGCTSGGGIKIFDHTAGSTFNIVMGGWREKDLEKAVVALQKFDLGRGKDHDGQPSTSTLDQEKFDAVFFVRGGRIRRFYDNYLNTVDTSFADQIVSRVSKTQASISLSQSDCRSTDDHVDSFRTMFRIPGGYPDSVSMHVDSGYILRKLKTKISGEELFNSFKQAQREGNKGAEATYFEELLHFCFRIEGLSPSISESVHAQGTGVEGVQELTKKNQYWVPSVPNFVNLDAALVGHDDKVWCFQYTVSNSHTYKRRRTKSHFLNHIPFLSTNDEVVIVFVVPDGTNFSTPDTGGELETALCSIDCSTLETVIECVQNLAAKVAAPMGLGR